MANSRIGCYLVQNFIFIIRCWNTSWRYIIIINFTKRLRTLIYKILKKYFIAKKISTNKLTLLINWYFLIVYFLVLNLYIFFDDDKLYHHQFLKTMLIKWWPFKHIHSWKQTLRFCMALWDTVIVIRRVLYRLVLRWLTRKNSSDPPVNDYR